MDGHRLQVEGGGELVCDLINPSNQWVSSERRRRIRPSTGRPSPLGGARLRWSRMERPAHGLCSSTASGGQRGGSAVQRDRCIVIGGDDGLTNYFNGTIDDVRVYNTALSSSQVQSLSTTAAAHGERRSRRPAAPPVCLSHPPSAPPSARRCRPARSVHLDQRLGQSVAATEAYNSSNNTATLTPSAALAYNTTYTATVSGARIAPAPP